MNAGMALSPAANTAVAGAVDTGKRSSAASTPFFALLAVFSQVGNTPDLQEGLPEPVEESRECLQDPAVCTMASLCQDDRFFPEVQQEQVETVTSGSGLAGSEELEQEVVAETLLDGKMDPEISGSREYLITSPLAGSSVPGISRDPGSAGEAANRLQTSFADLVASEGGFPAGKEGIQNAVQEGIPTVRPELAGSSQEMSQMPDAGLSRDPGSPGAVTNRLQTLFPDLVASEGGLPTGKEGVQNVIQEGIPLAARSDLTGSSQEAPDTAVFLAPEELPAGEKTISDPVQGKELKPVSLQGFDLTAFQTEITEEFQPHITREVEGKSPSLAAAQHETQALLNTWQAGERPEAVVAGEIVKQVVEKAHLFVGKELATLKLQLKPEFLGNLQLAVRVARGLVHAHFIAENTAVANMIAARLPELQQSLAEQGISWQQVSVSVDTQANSQGFAHMNPDGRGSPQQGGDSTASAAPGNYEPEVKQGRDLLQCSGLVDYLV